MPILTTGGGQLSNALRAAAYIGSNETVRALLAHHVDIKACGGFTIALCRLLPAEMLKSGGISTSRNGNRIVINTVWVWNLSAAGTADDSQVAAPSLTRINRWSSFSML